jgi:hypothetical protein
MSPTPTGSATPTITTGIVAVALIAARDACVTNAMMTSTFSRTSSAARSGSRSNLPCAHRYSNRTFRASTYPSSCNPVRRPLTALIVETSGLRTPITGVVGCCARTLSGHAAAPPSPPRDELASSHPSLPKGSAKLAHSCRSWPLSPLHFELLRNVRDWSAYPPKLITAVRLAAAGMPRPVLTLRPIADRL